MPDVCLLIPGSAQSARDQRFWLGKLSRAHPGPGPGENELMAGSSAPPALSKGDKQAAEALLTQALGEPTVVHTAEQVWDRGHVIRLHLASGRAVSG